MKISFLVHNVYSSGGTVRATATTANALAQRGHEVELVSVHRNRALPLYHFDDRIVIRSLTDSRPLLESRVGAIWRRGNSLRQRRLAQRQSAVFPFKSPGYLQYSQLCDERVQQWLATTDSSIVIGTKLGLNAYLARFHRPDTIVVGQEHRFLNSYRSSLRKTLSNLVNDLDAFVTLTNEDRRSYLQAVDKPDQIIRTIPNSIPIPVRLRCDITNPVIVAAGRLARAKGFDRLIDAFALLANDYPEWSVIIYGRGSESKNLHKQIQSHNLTDKIVLAGESKDIMSMWATGSIAVVPSRYEGFGMSLLEAMASGLPVVASDVPTGPRMLIEHHTNGLLAEPTVTGISKQLEQLMVDPQLRWDLGQAGMRTASKFKPDVITTEHEDLFSELIQGTTDRTLSLQGWVSLDLEIVCGDHPWNIGSQNRSLVVPVGSCLQKSPAMYMRNMQKLGDEFSTGGICRVH